MSLFLWGLVIIFAGGLASLFSGRKPGLATFLGSASAVVGSIVAVIPAFKSLLTGIYRITAIELERAGWFVFYPDRPHIRVIFNPDTWPVPLSRRFMALNISGHTVKRKISASRGFFITCFWRE